MEQIEKTTTPQLTRYILCIIHTSGILTNVCGLL